MIAEKPATVSTQLLARPEQFEAPCRRALSWAEARDYEGYSKYDALNSALLKALSFNNKYLRLAFSQMVMRAPLNIRGMVLVPKAKNPKGIGLFALAYLNLYSLYRREEDAAKARYCLDWLLAHCAQGYSGYCWGYNFDWQNVPFYVPRFEPNMVVTVVGARAFLRAYEVLGDGRFLNVARSAVDFISQDLNVLHSSGDMKCYSYTPFDTWAVLNVNALGGALMAMVSRHTGEREVREEAGKLIYYVVDKQTDYGAWYYTHPPGDSHLTHDNYHTGFILDSILDYSVSMGDEAFLESYWQGLEFYARNLFLLDGTPKFLHDRVYPIDIHGAAQGILTFSRAGCYDGEYLDQAIKVATWAVTQMQAPDGHFYYQRLRFFTKRFSLMRWNQAWMTYALSTLLVSLGSG